MSLAERLAQRRLARPARTAARGRSCAPPARWPRSAGASTGSCRRSSARSSTTSARWRCWSSGSGRRCRRCSPRRRRRSPRPTGPASRPRSATRSSGHGPLEPLLRDAGRQRNHGQRSGPDLRRAVRPHRAGRRRLHRRGAPAPHHRQDRRPGRPADRRGQPDGGRPPARRQPHQRGAAADRDGRRGADDPQVRRRPVQHGRPHRASAR